MTNIIKHLQWNVRREILLLLLYTFLCNLVVINMGATMGYSSIALPLLTNNTQSSIVLDSIEIPLFASIISIAQIAGSLLSLSMNYGRRFIMLLCGINYSLGWILIASSYNVIQLFIGRVLTGLAIGISTPTIEIYLSEISKTSWRSVITVTTSIAFTIGTLIVYILGFVIQNNWRLVAALFIIPSISFVLCNIFFIPETPQWLLLKGRKEEARNTLLRIRGLRHETIEFQEEFASMVNYIELTNTLEKSQNDQIDSSSTKKSGQRSFLTWNMWSTLKIVRRTICLREVWKPYAILNFYFFSQRFSGLYVIIFYTVDLITKINVTVDPYFITVIVGIIQVAGNVTTACCSKRIGRRPISIISGAGISISLGALVIYLQFFENTGIMSVPLACILFYVAFGSIGFFCIPRAMIPELYPTKYVSILGQLTMLFSFLCNYITIQLYPVMINYNRSATILFYCVFSIIATILLMIMLPETRGKTKTQIEENFKGKLQTNETFRKIENVY